MGLFSKFGKNKQQSPEDSGYYRAADDRAITERARSKRASSADGGATPGATRRGRKDGADPVLPEKKRARRRLVGAIALALAVAIGLPMVLDSEPKPLANDIAIQIPSKDKPAAAVDEPAPAVASRKHEQSDALDQSEEIVEPADDPVPPPKLAAAPVAPVHAQAPEPVKPKPEKVAEHKAEPKHDVKPEAKADVKAEPPKKLAEAKSESKPEPKKDAKPEVKPDDAARAIAILEGKPPAADSGRYVIQVAALSAKDKVEELQGKLRDAGIKSFTQKSPNGELTRVKVGPFGSREEAEKARAKLQKIGLSGSLVPA